MPELINCPSCQRKLQVPESLLGQDVQCPSCGTTFIGKAAGPEATPSPGNPPTSSYPPESPPPPSRARYDDDFSDVRRTRRSDLQPHRGTVVLVLGILSIVLAVTFVGVPGLILGPIAWTMGNTDLREIRAGRMDPQGEGLITGGRICGIIGFILGLLYSLLCCAYVVFIGAMVGAGGFKK